MSIRHLRFILFIFVIGCIVYGCSRFSGYV